MPWTHDVLLVRQDVRAVCQDCRASSVRSTTLFSQESIESGFNTTKALVTHDENGSDHHPVLDMLSYSCAVEAICYWRDFSVRAQVRGAWFRILTSSIVARCVSGASLGRRFSRERKCTDGELEGWSSLESWSGYYLSLYVLCVVLRESFFVCDV
jgi:hypothetical protein